MKSWNTPSLRHTAVVLALSAFAGCSSTPLTHYHTLIPSPAAVAAPRADYFFELLSVRIPPQVDQLALLIGDDQTAIATLDFEHWVGPLDDQIRAALSANIASETAAMDVYGVPHSTKIRNYRIEVSIRRFESLPGRSALVDAAWSIQPPAQKPGQELPPLTCESRVSETVGAGYDNLVAGHRRALAAIAHSIAATTRAMATGAGGTSCPSS